MGVAAAIYLCPPAIGEDKRIDNVGCVHLGAIPERRGKHLIDHLRRGEGPGPYGFKCPRSRLQSKRICRHAHAAGLALYFGDGRLHAVVHPAGVERKLDHRGIPDGRPNQPSHGIAETGHWIPCARRTLAHAKMQLAVPRIFLELYCAQENRTVQAAKGVIGHIFNSCRVGGVEKFFLGRVAHNHACAAARERCNEVSLQVRSFCEADRFAANQACIVVVRRRARCGVERRREQPMRLEPAFLRPRRSRPTVKRQTGTGEQFVDRYVLENNVGAVGSKLPPRPNDCRRKPALGAELLRRRRCGCATNWFHCRFDTIQVVEVVGVIRRHRIGMEDESTCFFVTQRRHRIRARQCNGLQQTRSAGRRS